MKYPFECITDLVFVNKDQLEISDIILVPGGSHPQLIERAVELYHLGLAPYILPSGGYNAKINQTEWEFMNEIAIKMGVPQEAIIKENEAKNTFDNARNSWNLIIERNIKVSQVIMVCKAQHSRRALMTYQTVFPLNVRFLMEPIQDKNNITRDNWFLDEKKINAVMGEVEKISKYFVHHIPNWIKKDIGS
ncbi:YdcF family protein [Gorillibacterium sp. sgz5001074]|uniref:YdcF family protein n=1 Tax=Gorillibacterium sp. sgz5001074 TaxID=3446695 RepID=UPI003F67CBAB